MRIRKPHRREPAVKEKTKMKFPVTNPVEKIEPVEQPAQDITIGPGESIHIPARPVEDDPDWAAYDEARKVAKQILSILPRVSQSTGELVVTELIIEGFKRRDDPSYAKAEDEKARALADTKGRGQKLDAPDLPPVDIDE